jgi:hypothetical protein
MIGMKLKLNYPLALYGSLGKNGFEDKTEENLERGKFNIEITDFGSLT